MPRRAKRSAGLGLRHANKKIKTYRNRVKKNIDLELPCLNKNPTNAGEKDPPSEKSVKNESVGLYVQDKVRNEVGVKVCKQNQKISTVAYYLFEVKYKGLAEQVLQEGWGGEDTVSPRVSRRTWVSKKVMDSKGFSCM